MIERALENGHELTMFNRGLTNPDLYPGVERLHGDRSSEEGLSILKGREWDAVIDTCGYDHRVVQKTLDVLKDQVGHYTYVSSISVYADSSTPNRENAPNATLLGDPDVPMGRPFGGSAHYGPLKVLCEDAVADAFPGRSMRVRLTIGVGPKFTGADSALGVTYWAKRVRDHPTVLVPGPRDRPVSFIDLRDLASFVVEGAEKGTTGDFNVAAPRTTIEDALTICMGVFGTKPELVFADPDWLIEQGVSQNTELPWWIAGDPYAYYFGAVQDKAVASGLRARPMADSVRDTVEWEDEQNAAAAALAEKEMQSGEAATLWDSLMSREREEQLIELWRAQQGA
jgi:2'-hydroxyisoflavone reductase